MRAYHGRAETTWLLGLLLLSSIAAEADAGVLSGTRSNWTVAAGWNFGRGAWEDPAGERTRYSEGSSAQIRAGRMLGNHLQVAIDYQGWAIEGGALQDSMGVKARRGLQNLAATISVFPGKPGTALGSLYLRAGVGMGWVSTGLKPFELGVEITEGETHHEWGTGFLSEIGYELWVHRSFSIAPGVAFNYFEIGGGPFEVEGIALPGTDRAAFLAGQVTFNVYFGGE